MEKKQVFLAPPPHGAGGRRYSIVSKNQLAANNSEKFLPLLITEYLSVPERSEVTEVAKMAIRVATE